MPLLQIIDGEFTKWLFNQAGSVIVLIGGGLLVFRGLLRTKQELDAVVESRNTYKGYVDTLVPAITALTGLVQSGQAEFKAEIATVVVALDGVTREIRTLNDRRNSGRADGN